MPEKPPPSAASNGDVDPTDDEKKAKAVRWSSEVKDSAKKKPPPTATATAAVNNDHKKDADEAASEQLARALDAQNPTGPSTTTSARIKLENDWELTWPIWHMLPWMERKEIAQRHGYHTIGAFEEYMSLQKALDNESAATAGTPYSNKLAYPVKLPPKDDSKTAADTVEEEDDDTDTEDDDKAATTSETETDEEIDTDSPLLTFPDEILHKIFGFLPVTLYGTKLAYVSLHPHWRRTTGSEPVMKQLCERVYLQQSKKKQLRVSKFHHSYRFMLYQRPRVQAGGGLYVLRYGRVKPIQRDMWTEVPVGAILETVYYRYLYFEEQGHCLYALTTIPPHDMLKRFHRVLLQSSYENPTTTLFELEKGKRKVPRQLKGKEKERRAAELDTRVVWGTYTIQKDQVTVTAKQSWQTVQFGLRIVTHHNRPYEEHDYLQHHHHHHEKDGPTSSTPKPTVTRQSTAGKKSSDEDRYVHGCDIPTVSPHGRFGILQLETHRSSVSGNFEEHDTYLEQMGHEQHPQLYHQSDVVNYTVEVDQVFRFLPDARF